MLQVKLFDEEHEKDLEQSINRFLEVIPEQKFVDVKYSVAAMGDSEDLDQIYCFSALVLYRK